MLGLGLSLVSLKNKKPLAVKLKDENDYYLVACDDGKSINTSLNPTPPETAQWIIKGKDPEKQVRIVSIYGKYLGAQGGTYRLIQTDKGKADVNVLWRLEESEKGFPKVYLRPSQHDLEYYLMSSFDGKVELGFLSSTLDRWINRATCRWEVKVLNKPKPFIEKEEGSSTAGSTIQFVQQVNYNGGLGEISNVNSGKNVNYGPGNQINGSINIRSEHNGKIVNIFRKI